MNNQTTIKNLVEEEISFADYVLVILDIFEQ